MKAYGRRKYDDLTVCYLGAPSKHRKNRSTVRKRSRRLLHKQARNDAKKDLASLYPNA